MVRKVANHKTQVSLSYWSLSRQPLQSLVFLLPLILLYEAGIPVYAQDPASGLRVDNYAHSLFNDFFELLGAPGYYLPGLMVVVVLLCWHVARRDPWKADLGVCVVMWAEALLLALPLFVFMLMLVRSPSVSAPQASVLTVIAQTLPMAEPTPDRWQAQLLFNIGAGIYEELLFRLIAIALLHLVLVDVLALPETVGAVGSVALSAVAFAAYHFPSLSAFELWRGLFYIVAGVYFAGVYVVRGFGIVVAVHALYDVLVFVLEIVQRR